MRTLLLGTGYHRDLEPLSSYRPSLLLHVADKPVIFHIIESLVQLGCREVHIILHHFPEQIEKRLGNGKRWGADIHYHLIKDPSSPLPMIRVISRKWDNSPVLIGQGDTLPDLKNSSMKEATFFFNKEIWTGWGILSSEKLRTLPADKTFAAIPESIGEYRKEEVETLLDCRSLKGLIEGNQSQIAKEEPQILFPTTANQVEQGIWISRGAVIEPGAMILPPVFLGVNSHVRSGAVIGPNSIIERFSLIGNHSRIKNSLICQNSYIGENLEIENCVVDRSSLINLKHGTSLNIKEQFILSDTSAPPLGRYLFEILEKGLALLLFCVLSPIYFWLRSHCETKNYEAVLLPSSSLRKEWKTVIFEAFIPQTPFQRFFRRLPYVWEIVRGNLHFIGVPPRPPSQIEKMPADWKTLYLHSKLGLITLAQIDCGPQATLDEQYASEAFYTAHMGLFYDCKLFFRWLFKKIGLTK